MRLSYQKFLQLASHWPIAKDVTLIDFSVGAAEAHKYYSEYCKLMGTIPDYIPGTTFPIWAKLKLYQRQNKSCLFCGWPGVLPQHRKNHDGTHSGGHLAVLLVDHNHQTYETRGLLCYSCNIDDVLSEMEPFVKGMF